MQTQVDGVVEFVLDRVDLGVVVVDTKMNIQVWNRFMANHSERGAEELNGCNLFSSFPELPRAWLEKKINGVFMLKNFAFSSWQQRPHLFKFAHNRPITGGAEYMYQNCSIMPIRSEHGMVSHICITVKDVTDEAFAQQMLQDTLVILEEANRIDGLTNLYNRMHWESRLAEEFKRVKRYGTDSCMLLFDLDHFKAVNDTHGHLAGDDVLRAVSKVVKDLLREPDVAGRYGGEEFGVILPSTPMGGAEGVAERIRLAVELLEVKTVSQIIRPTVSVGVAEMTPMLNRYEDVIANADAMLYEAKRTGRNRVCCFGA